jgi:hypothetical protein
LGPAMRCGHAPTRHLTCSGTSHHASTLPSRLPRHALTATPSRMQNTGSSREPTCCGPAAVAVSMLHRCWSRLFAPSLQNR